MNTELLEEDEGVGMRWGRWLIKQRTPEVGAEQPTDNLTPNSQRSFEPRVAGFHLHFNMD